MINIAGLWIFLLGFLITLCLITFQAGDAFGQEMTFPGKEWEEATPESQGVYSAKLREALNYLAENSGSDSVKEVVIIRNGYLIWKGDNVAGMIFPCPTWLYSAHTASTHITPFLPRTKDSLADFR